MSTHVAAPTTPVPVPAARANSLLSLDRTTEQDGIVVDEGFCEAPDPSFGDAASRLACLELEDFEDASSRPTSSNRSLKTSTSQRSASSVGSRSLRAGGSSKSLQSPRRAPPQLSQASTSSKSQGSSQAGAGAAERSGPPLEVLTSVKSGESLPPGSPFGCEEWQSARFPAPPDAGDARSKLRGLNNGIDAHLMAGLQSLEPNELALYMQLTEQLISDGVAQPASPAAATAAGGSPAAAERGQQDAAAAAAADDPRLADAVRQLRARLPAAAIEQLQSHASYGLLDVIRGQPVTPPPTPTAGEEP